MPHSRDAERELADAREALARGALRPAADHAWAAAAAAASIGDEDSLSALLDVVGTLAEQTSGRDHDDAEQLRVYVAEALEGARDGTRPQSAFERLITRERRPR
jgi:hypothetical protein